jgi:hypothetical protein
MSTALNRLLNTGTKAAEEPAEYRAFVDSGGKPQAAFAITHANGDMDGFLYHLLDNMDCKTRNGTEFLSFTHRGKAVTMQGTKLKIIFRAMTRHTLMEIHEQGGRPAEPGQPTVTRLEVTVVGQGAPMVRLAG